RRFISHPLWVFFLLPFIPIYLIVSILLTEDIRCYTLFCPRHKNYFLVRSLFVWGSLIVVLALSVGGFVLTFSLSQYVDKSKENTLGGSFCIGTVLLFVGWLISIPISQVTAIHPAKATRSRLTLKRVSPAFAEAVLQHRENSTLEAQPADY